MTAPTGAESLEVWNVQQPVWRKMGTIIRKGGRQGTITCDPADLDFLLRRPGLIGMDPMDFLSGWSNGYVSVWPKGTAPGAPKPDAPKVRIRPGNDAVRNRTEHSTS